MAQLSAFGLVELVLNAAALLCGVICASALTVTQGEFDGKCILYGEVLYNGQLTLSSSSSLSLCYFVSAISIMGAIFSFAVLLFKIYHCCFSSGQTAHGWFKCSLVLLAGVLFFLLVSAFILRFGMDALCTSIQKSVAVQSCQDAQHSPWVKPYHAERFYDNLYTAEAAAWVNFLFWCLMVALLIVEHFSKPSSRDETTPIIGEGPHIP
ncbi:transmembrane protein 179B-like [Elgaria multicarinata webbii]|uniref:transmembrane protein 179B-like n=1 Tax=Elgaria multicarinata webbii TaxID=159646 RepID=UPI002FCD2B01